MAKNKKPIVLDVVTVETPTDVVEEGAEFEATASDPKEEGFVDLTSSELEESEEEVTEPATQNTSGAVLVEPDRGQPKAFRATQNQLYHPYFRLYFHADGGPDGKGTMVPYVDSWTKCQLDAGLLEEVVSE